MNDSVGNTINKIRAICKFFKRSPVQNDRLQQKIRKAEGKRLNLILDCRTRWNSLANMLNRFLKVKDHVQCVVSKLSIADQFPSESEIVSVKGLCESLNNV